MSYWYNLASSRYVNMGRGRSKLQEGNEILNLAPFVRALIVAGTVELTAMADLKSNDGRV